jgi:peptidoglycan/xylan/chitin deacetylase (PgdA/CDA1 family)
VRNAAAKCYFHFRVPEVTRSLRERYQLSTAPKVSWKRRTQASARILYYHRVNDDNDPFFPAISTELFEQEMRYVSRNYKVVSLSELMNHLDGGVAEPQVAITFDDGYQDNYTQAFPILQRYGLPAAIFLATGSIDSREPLWFERLAEAVKNTPLEFIDLEIDLPRRFWTRTTAERLDANGRIFALLRGLRDSERQEHLPRILQQLSAPAESERNDKMLTWDQVRLMKKHGIDFGGHTVTHPFLSRMTAEQVTWEVTGCKRRIEEELQSEARYFAYPNGREEDFGKWNKDLIRNAGYQAAVTTIWGVNYPSTDPMELRRGQPWEENPALFAYKLDWYQLVND